MNYYCFSLVPYHSAAMTLRFFFLKDEKVFCKDLKILTGTLEKNKEQIEKNIIEYFTNNILNKTLKKNLALNKEQVKLVKSVFSESFILTSDDIDNYFIIKDIIE